MAHPEGVAPVALTLTMAHPEGVAPVALTLTMAHPEGVAPVLGPYRSDEGEQ
jgi:hypothetical protein